MREGAGKVGYKRDRKSTGAREKLQGVLRGSWGGGEARGNYYGREGGQEEGSGSGKRCANGGERAARSGGTEAPGVRRRRLGGRGRGAGILATKLCRPVRSSGLGGEGRANILEGGGAWGVRDGEDGGRE